MYKIILTVDESLALISYVGLLKYFIKEDKNIHNVYKILDQNTHMESVILKSEVIYNIDSLSLSILRNFIKDQLNGPLAKYDIDKNIFMAILDKLDNSLMPPN